MAGPVRFMLRGVVRAVSGLDPTMTVLEYLRGVEGRLGTKEGCAEGDCGACTVALGTPEDGAIRYRAVNACIMPVAMIHGCELVTADDLKAPGGALHPVQRAMVAEHGSQCGFCTPGFVMSLFALHHGGRAAHEQDVRDALAGNLCRCTGYGPIIRAGLSVATGQADDAFAGRAKATFGTLTEIRAAGDAIIEQAGRRALVPVSLASLLDLLGAHPDAWLIAGATDAGLWLTKRLERPGTVIFLGRVSELSRIAHSDAHTDIGAAVSFSDAATAITDDYPEAAEVIRRLGSVQVRNLGTVGGNIANGSPIGDSPPPLIAAGARLLLEGKDGTREMALEDFFIAYGKQDLRSGEIVRAIRLPRRPPGSLFRAYKISKRFDQDITAVTAAYRLRMAGGVIVEPRVCYGGMAATPKRAGACEAALNGKPWNEDTVQAAMAALDTDYAPISDHRASAGYRRTVAKNLLRRAFLETTEPGMPAQILFGGGHA